MRIEFVQRNYEMSDKLKEVAEKKVEKLSRYFEDETTAKIALKKQKEIYKMEISINFNGMFIRAEVSGDNMYDNIDLILPKIEKQIFKYRTKLQKQLKQNAFKEEMLFGKPEDIEESKVVRIKKFDLKPMDVEDAIMELDLVDHDFYIYLDEKTKDVNIVYRRSDGNIGVLQPN